MYPQRTGFLYIAATLMLAACGGGDEQAFVLNPTSLDFGEVDVGDSETMSVQINNGTGDLAAIVSTSFTGVDDNIFSAELSYPFYIPEDSTVGIQLNFEPAEAIDYSGTVSFVFDSGAAVALTVSGSGAGDGTEVDPTPTENNGTPKPGDEDGDGFTAEEGDCDDDNPGIYPGAVEICGDGLDQDCNQIPDDGPDLDNDSYIACGDNYDCDDTNALIYPGAPEQCDGVDSDCDGAIDEDSDADGDGFSTCGATGGLDCDDNNPNTYPGANDGCLPGDNDCDNVIDEDVGGIDCTSSCPVYATKSDTPVAQADGSPLNPFPSIGSAVVNRGDCDTVYVSAGTYSETVTIPEGEDVIIEAVQGPASTTIQANGAPAMRLLGGQTHETQITGFTFTGAGGADGGCVDLNNASPTIIGNIFDGCVATGNGGAIYSDIGAPRIAENIFRNNRGLAGGAIYATVATEADGFTLNGNTFEGNSTSEGHGGAAYILGLVDGEISNNTFSENQSADRCGGIRVEGFDGLTFTYNTFQENFANTDGGGAGFSGGANLTADNNTYTANDAGGDIGGGGSFISDTQGAVVTNDTHTANTTNGGGGGLLLLSSTNVSISESAFTGNEAGEYGGGMAATNSNSTSITNSTFTDNVGVGGGGIALYSGGFYEMVGLEVVNNIDNTEFYNPTAITGGGGIMFRSDVQGDLRHSIIRNNTSLTNGGGIAVLDCGPKIRNNLILGNTAYYDGVLLTGQGGGLYVWEGDPQMTFNTIVGNLGAGGGGGAVWSVGSDGITWEANIVAFNPEGDGLEAYSPTSTFRHNNVFGNDSGDYSNYDGFEAWPFDPWEDQTGQNGNISLDPQFAIWTNDGDYSNDDYHLANTSPCVDSAPSTIDYLDPDGSAGDMGAYGGPLGSW